MDEEPVLALALSLGQAEALNDPRIGKVRRFVRQVEDPNGDVASLAAADRMVRGEEAALNGTEFYNLMVNIRSLNGVEILGLSSESAMEVIDRIWAAMS